jgi:DNA processing protein
VGGNVHKNNTRNILLLLKQFGFTDKTLKTIFSQEESILDVIYDHMHPFHNKYFDIFTEKEKEISKNYRALRDFSIGFIEKMRDFKEKGIKIYYCFDEDYPSYIFEKENQPLFLYCYGNVELLNQNKKKVAIIGTRNPTIGGIEATKGYVAKYVLHDWVTVSGLATGIDTEVHNETINNNGNTIAVIPTSFDKIYPKENEGLFNNIVDNNGLVISTYGPFENTYKSNFLDRNSIVAKMSDEIFVIEASIKSGTLNTVRQGYKFGKKIVFDSKLLSEEVIDYMGRFNAVDFKIERS